MSINKLDICSVQINILHRLVLWNYLKILIIYFRDVILGMFPQTKETSICVQCIFITNLKVRKEFNRFGDIYKLLTLMIFYTSLVGVYSVNSMMCSIATHAMEWQSLIWTQQHFKLFKVCETITHPLTWKILFDYKMSYPGPTFGRRLKSYHEY